MNEKIIAGVVLNVLALEDSVPDFEIIREQLIDAGYNLNISRVDKEKEFESSIRGNQYDIILADFKLPGFDAFGALRLCNAICPEVPFICVSGSIGEETAIELIKLGAIDYVLKDRLARLPSAVKRALDEAKEKGKRKRVDEMLTAETANLDAIFESSPVAMFILDETTNIVRVNTAALVLCGGSAPDVLQHRPGNALRCVHSSKDPRGCGYAPDCPLCPARNGIEALLAGGGTMHEAELVLDLIRDGAPRKVWMGIGAEPVQIDGRRHLCVAMEDITKRKRAEEALRESEERYRCITENMSDFVSELDAQGVFRYSSPSIRRILGYDPEELIGSSAFDLVHPEDRDLVIATYRDGVKTESDRDVDQRYRRKDGTYIWLRSSGHPLSGSDGKNIGMIINSNDITERKLAESQREAALEEIRKLNETLEQRIKERTADLTKTIAQLEETNRVFVGRELRMIELKKRIAELEQKDS